MTDREKLIDLIINAKRTDPETGSFTEYLADFLLGYGVKLPDDRPVSRERVEKVWSPCNFCAGAKYITGGVTAVYPVSETHQQETLAEGGFDFCPVCGRPITDEAVEMVMERLEAIE